MDMEEVFNDQVGRDARRSMGREQHIYRVLGERDDTCEGEAVLSVEDDDLERARERPRPWIVWIGHSRVALERHAVARAPSDDERHERLPSDPLCSPERSHGRSGHGASSTCTHGDTSFPQSGASYLEVDPFAGRTPAARPRRRLRSSASIRRRRMSAPCRWTASG